MYLENRIFSIWESKYWVRLRAYIFCDDTIVNELRGAEDRIEIADMAVVRESGRVQYEGRKLSIPIYSQTQGLRKMNSTTGTLCQVNASGGDHRNGMSD